MKIHSKIMVNKIHYNTINYYPEGKFFLLSPSFSAMRIYRAQLRCVSSGVYKTYCIAPRFGEKIDIGVVNVLSRLLPPADNLNGERIYNGGGSVLSRLL